MLIVGSSALAHYTTRSVKDHDIIAFREQALEHFKSFDIIKESKYSILFKKDYVVDCILADNSEALQAYLEFEGANNNRFKIASLDTLLSLKASHVHYPLRNFQRHVEDYSWLWKQLGEDKLAPITEQQIKETELRLGKLKTPSLNKSVESFFGQSDGKVETWFVHDDVHRVMAHKEVPLYELMQRDKTKAKCEKDLWEKFSHLEKCQCVLEEAYVIALERKIIPSIYGGAPRVSPKMALDWSLMRICTTLTSGWFRDFACKYYLDIKDTHNPNYYKVFTSAVKNDRIKLI